MRARKGLVHSQKRDASSGLYPLTLVTAVQHEEDCKPPVVIGAEDHRLEASFIRKHYDRFTGWANFVLSEQSKQSERVSDHQQTNAIEFDQRINTGLLTRVYRKPGISDYDHWHARIGHLGSKWLRKI